MATKNPTVKAPVDAAAKTKTKTVRARKGGGESKHSPRRIVAVEQQAKALEYRKMGLSYPQIAEKVGFASPQAAWYACDSAMKRTVQEPAQAVRELELARLDAMFVGVYSNACRGDLQSATTALSIMSRRARLLGLDAPERKELTGAEGKAFMLAPTIIIGGMGEEGEPDVAGVSVAPPAQE